MNSLIPEAWAQGSGPAAGSQLAPLLMMVVFIVIFYFLLIRPQQRKAKEHQAMISKIAATVVDAVLAAARGSRP